MNGGNAGAQAASGGSNVTVGGAGGFGGVSDAGVAGEATAGEGGLNASGAAGSAGSDDAGGQFVAKFCNTLSFGSDDTTMILEVGEGADRVTFSAVTGTCSPPDGDACRPIPAGADVLVQLTDSTDLTIPLDTGTASIEAGAEIVFSTDVSDAQPVWNGLILDGGPTCEEFSFDDL